MTRRRRSRQPQQPRRSQLRHRPPLEQIQRHSDDVIAAIETAVRWRRPYDSVEDRMAMAHSAWVHLLQHCQHHRHVVVDWEWMRTAIGYAVRKGIRDYAAYTHDLPITAYARYVSGCYLRGVGRDFWPAGTTFSELAETFNTSGEDDEVRRRREQHRCLDGDDLEAIAEWIQQARTPLDPDLVHAGGGGGFNVLGDTVVAPLRTCDLTISPAARTLARAYADALQDALTSHTELPTLTAVASTVGLRGGSRDRAIAAVRRIIRAAFDD
jgi:hypothetical protein